MTDMQEPRIEFTHGTTIEQHNSDNHNHNRNLFSAA